MRLILVASLGLLIALLPFLARAADDPAAQPLPGQSVQEVISHQLNAIHDRDADAAFATLTHDFGENFEDSKNFMNDLRFEHRAIYNHEDFTFLNKQGADNGPVSIQKVRMNDHYGDPITVIYRMEQQADGSWLIDSFTVLDAEAQPI